MIRAIINWIKIVRYFRVYRRQGVGSFTIVTIAREIIIYPEKRFKRIKGKEQLRLNWKSEGLLESIGLPPTDQNQSEEK